MNNFLKRDASEISMDNMDEALSEFKMIETPITEDSFIKWFVDFESRSKIKKAKSSILILILIIIFVFSRVDACSSCKGNGEGSIKS